MFIKITYDGKSFKGLSTFFVWFANTKCCLFITAQNVTLVDDIKQGFFKLKSVKRLLYYFRTDAFDISSSVYCNNVHRPFLSISPNMSFVFLVNCIKMVYGRGSNYV